MILLLASIISLALGPLIVRMVRNSSTPLAALDAFVIISVGGMVLLHILPQSIVISGQTSIGVALLGLVASIWIERSLGRTTVSSALTILPLAYVGLAAHAFLDGIALSAEASEHSQSGQLLAIAVVLHRFPMGLAIWWVIKPLFGTMVAISAMAILVLASGLGLLFGDALLPLVSNSILGLSQAFIAGALFHVILHHPPIQDQRVSSKQNYASAAGAILGIVVLTMLGVLHPQSQENSALNDPLPGEIAIVTLLLNSAPAIGLAIGIMALAVAVFPHGWATAMANKYSLSSYNADAMRSMSGIPNLPGASPPRRSSLFGLFSFFQSSNLRQGEIQVHRAAVLLTLLITWKLWGIQLSLLYFFATGILFFSLAFGVRYLATRSRPIDLFTGRLKPRPARHSTHAGSPAQAYFEAMDHLSPWLLAGFSIAAALETVLPVGWTLPFPTGFEVPIAAMFGLPFFIYGPAAVPIGAVLLHKGVSPGATVAFMLTLQAINPKTFQLLWRIEGRRVSIGTGTLIAGVAILLGYLVSFLSSFSHGILPDLSQATSPQWVEVVAVAIFMSVIVISLFRQGTRQFLAQVVGSHVAWEQESSHTHSHNSIGHPDRDIAHLDSSDHMMHLKHPHSLDQVPPTSH